MKLRIIGKTASLWLLQITLLCLISPSFAQEPSSPPSMSNETIANDTPRPTMTPTMAQTLAPSTTPPVDTTPPVAMGTAQPSPMPTDFDEPQTVGPTPMTPETGTPISTMAPSPMGTNMPTPNNGSSMTASPTASPTALPTASPTDFPTANPTKNPTAPPTDQPSLAPQPDPTLSPTGNPSNIPQTIVPVVGKVLIQLAPAPTLLIGDTEQTFLRTTVTYLTLKFPEIEGIIVVIERQFWSRRRDRRQLQTDPLFVEIGVTGRRVLPDGEDAFDFDATLADAFESDADQYLQALKGTGDSYFEPIDEILVISNSDAPTPTDAPVFIVIPTEAPVSAPTPVDDNDSVLTLAAIVVIAVGGLIVIVVAMLLIKRALEDRDTTDNNTFSSGPTSSGDPNHKKPWLRNTRNGRNGADHQEASQKLMQHDSSDVESQALYSYVQGDNDSFMGSAMQNNSVAMDTMSYAYSLEPGIEPSVVSGMTSGKDGNTIPTEIPQFRPKAPASKQDSIVSSTQDSEFGFEPTLSDHEQIQATGSDLRLTESELNMLPSNLAKSTSSEGDQGNLKTRKVQAPPGKLGIIIDTTVEGPVVHHVNDNSALKGKIFPGDIIIAIDDVDTRAMSASAITALMVKTAKQRRKLTVVSDPTR